LWLAASDYAGGFGLDGRGFAVLRSIFQVVMVASLLAGSAGVVAQDFTWPRAEAAEVGVDPAMLQQLDTAVRAGQYGQVKSLLVLRHGKLVYESYFNGYRAEDLLPLYSVTKSWASALIGIALQRGDLAGIDQPLWEILPQYSAAFNASPQKRSIRVRDLMTMRHGLQWDEWSTSFTSSANPVNQMTKAADWWQYVLSRPMTASRDSVFRYSTGTSNLLGAVIFGLTGQSAMEYSQQHLFEALDIHDWYLEVDLADGPRGSGIGSFQQGLTPTGHGLWLKATDLAKLGQLYLDRGVFNGQRIFTANWVDQSWQPYSTSATDPAVFSGGNSYGLQWWNLRMDTPAGPVQVRMAEGYGDQFLLLVPELDLLVVSNANNGQHTGPDMRHALKDLILPAVSADFDPVNDGGLTGTWIAPTLQHQGFMLEIVPATGQIVIYWMAFEPPPIGQPDAQPAPQQWMLAAGQLHDRRALLEFLRPINGVFGGNQPAEMQYWGEAELRFLSCTSAEMWFDSPVDGVEGQLELIRLTPNTWCQDP
jgi:CubicO group peptidase (beta-lactamase class C family)